VQERCPAKVCVTLDVPTGGGDLAHGFSNGIATISKSLSLGPVS
jgi:hypothetical protein